MNELEARVTELEIRYTHQTELVEELNQVVIAERRRSDQLERELRRIMGTIKSLGSDLTQSPDE